MMDIFRGAESEEILTERVGQQEGFQKGMWKNVGDKGVDLPD